MGRFVTRSATFQLIPFGQNGDGVLAITGIVSRSGGSLALSYQVSGDIGSLLLPARVAAPGRCDELWRSTCCECFLRFAGQPAYYELNVSPSGNWNVYRFTDYRAGMREDSSVAEFECQTSSEEKSFFLHCAVQLDGLAEGGHGIELGISCVLMHTDGTTSYWALSHPGQRPDFHHPEAFVLRL